MKYFIKKIISDNNGYSLKRVIGLVGFLVLLSLLVLTSISNFAKVPPESLTSAIEVITIAALFGTVAEKIKKYFNTQNTNPTNSPTNEDA